MKNPHCKQTYIRRPRPYRKKTLGNIKFSVLFRCLIFIAHSKFISARLQPSREAETEFAKWQHGFSIKSRKRHTHFPNSIINFCVVWLYFVCYFRICSWHPHFYVCYSLEFTAFSVCLILIVVLSLLYYDFMAAVGVTQRKTRRYLPHYTVFYICLIPLTWFSANGSDRCNK